jgi:hypothetical protein
MRVETGNVDELNNKNPERRGWFIGDFIEKDSLFNSSACEIKWTKHKKGLKKTSGNDLDENTITVGVLVSGKWKSIYPAEKREIILSKLGDFVAYEGMYHENEALEDTQLIVIRWKNKNA